MSDELTEQGHTARGDIVDLAALPGIVDLHTQEHVVRDLRTARDEFVHQINDTGHMGEDNDHELDQLIAYEETAIRLHVEEDALAQQIEEVRQFADAAHHFVDAHTAQEIERRFASEIARAQTLLVGNQAKEAEESLYMLERVRNAVMHGRRFSDDSTDILREARASRFAER